MNTMDTSFDKFRIKTIETIKKDKKSADQVRIALFIDANASMPKEFLDNRELLKKDDAFLTFFKKYFKEDL